jgi:hypothetical protein
MASTKCATIGAGTQSNLLSQHKIIWLHYGCTTLPKQESFAPKYGIWPIQTPLAMRRTFLRVLGITAGEYASRFKRSQSQTEMDR